MIILSSLMNSVPSQPTASANGSPPIKPAITPSAIAMAMRQCSCWCHLAPGMVALISLLLVGPLTAIPDIVVKPAADRQPGTAPKVNRIAWPWWGSEEVRMRGEAVRGRLPASHPRSRSPRRLNPCPQHAKTQTAPASTARGAAEAAARDRPHSAAERESPLGATLIWYIFRSYSSRNAEVSEVSRRTVPASRPSR